MNKITKYIKKFAKKYITRTHVYLLVANVLLYIMLALFIYAIQADTVLRMWWN